MPELFGVRIASPREIFDSATATAQSLGDGASRFGSSALSRANELGRTIDSTVRDVGAQVDRAIGQAQTAAQTGLRDGVTWTGQRIHDGANAARAVVGDDTLLGRAATSVITGAETRARFSVGVVGGVATEVVGLAGTVATLGSTALQVQLSPTRREEVATAIAGAVSTGLDTAVRYGQSVATDPGRLVTDAQAVRQGAMDLGGRVVGHYQTAIAEGRGPEAFGMTAGQVLANVVPIGAGANAARLGATGVLSMAGREGGEIAAREGAEAVAREGVEAGAREGTETVARGAGRADEVPTIAARATERSATVGRNEVSWRMDAEGRPVHAEATLREVFSGLDRSPAELRAQREAASRGIDGDQGGHVLGHRFVQDQGLDNMFPQNANFNTSAYKKFENEMADWVNAGGEVRVQIDLPSANRPDNVGVVYEVVDPRTGQVVYDNSVLFRNEAGQEFNRVASSDMNAYLSQ